MNKLIVKLRCIDKEFKLKNTLKILNLNLIIVNVKKKNTFQKALNSSLIRINIDARIYPIYKNGICSGAS